jgi:thiol-disulfide isomerase/thioredoxin
LRYYSQLSGNEKNDAVKHLSNKRQELFLNEIEQITINNYLRLIDSMYVPPKSDILKTFLLAKGKNAFAQAYPSIIKSMQTAWCRKIADGELRETALKQRQIDSLLAKGTSVTNNSLYIGDPLEHLPFNADLYKLDTLENVDAFIIDLRSKFPNKALVIDFWATWCAPCLKELPPSKQLHENNKDLPIVFIYICTNSGSNTTVWKNKIAGLQLPGTHIFADDKLVSELKSKFNSKESGFPAYVVIDIKGKLKPKAIERMESLDRDKLKSAAGLK